MNLDEFKTAKVKLEQDLRTSVVALYNQFKDDTGVSPTSIDIHILDASVIGSKPERIVGKVWVSCSDL